MSKTLMASAICLTLGFSGYAMANPCAEGDSSCNQSNSGGGSNSLSAIAQSTQSGSGPAANEGSTVYSNAFNTSKAIAKTNLEGYVSGITIHNIGNSVYNEGDANGGNGGKGGKGIGGDGGDAHAWGGTGGKGSGGDGTAGAISAAVGGYAEGEGGKGSAHSHEGDVNASATGGAGTATAGGASSGSASASAGGGAGTGGNGGSAVSVAGNGAAGNGGGGGGGGNGGTNALNAGTFDMSSNMSNVGNSAAGVMVISQNSGFASLAQQGVTIQANLNVGK